MASDKPEATTAIVLVDDSASETAVVVRDERWNALDKPAADESRNPATVYVASLTTKQSKATAVSALKRVAAILGEEPERWEKLPWALLTASAASDVRAALVDKYGPTTARTTLSILRSVLRTAWRMGQVSGDRFERVTAWGGVKGETPVKGRELSAEEIRALKQHCERQQAGYGALHWAVCACALGGGLRRFELAGLRVSDLSDDGRHLLIRGKGNKTVVHPIDAWVGGALEEWLAWRDRIKPALAHDGMFAYARGASDIVTDAPINEWHVWKLLTTLGAEAGLAHFTPHDLRRTYLTAYIRKKKDLAMAQKLARHASQATTARYDMRTVEEMAEEAKVVGDVWFAKD